MSLLFLALLTVHGAVSILIHRTAPPNALSGARKYLLLAVQLLLFGLGVYFAAQFGAFDRRLLSPIYIALGILGGHLIFGVSLLITHRSVEDAWSHFFDVRAPWKFLVDHPYVLSRFVYVGVSEEIIWRAAAQPVAIQLFAQPLAAGPAATAAITLVAFLFAIVHEHFFKNTWFVSFEFFGFAILLGVLYYWTESLIFVILIHIVRDFEITYLEYVIKVHEYGDEQRASREMQEAYLTPSRARRG